MRGKTRIYPKKSCSACWGRSKREQLKELAAPVLERDTPEPFRGCHAKSTGKAGYF